MFHENMLNDTILDAMYEADELDLIDWRREEMDQDEQYRRDDDDSENAGW